MTAPATVPPWAHALMSQAWGAQASWTVLDTNFGAGHTFLELWQSWRAHPHRPRLLHYVGVLPPHAASALCTSLTGDLGHVLASYCYDLEPGIHRVLLEDGQLSLTLCVGDVGSMLAQQTMQADWLLVATPVEPWNKWHIKALARCCTRGAQVVFIGQRPPEPQLLSGAGFTAADAGGHAVFEPRWSVRRGANRADLTHLGSPVFGTQKVAVVGAGMAGASVARALALRGFNVDVYDTQAQPAGGASGLPVGLVVPHHSADDSPRSRMSRKGTRLMLQHASRMLQTGQDWSPTGVLELAIGADGLPEAEAEMVSEALNFRPETCPAMTGWASPMAYGEVAGLWHSHAAWIKPARLVAQWLDHPRIRFQGQARVHSLVQVQDQWQLQDANGLALGSAHHMVFANAYGCVDVLGRLAAQSASSERPIPWVNDVLNKLDRLQALHGTVSQGPMTEASEGATDALPPFPVNGHGSFVSGVPTLQGPRWFAGATFHNEATPQKDLPLEHAANFRKLQALLPAVAETLKPQFATQQVEAWTGSRCVTHDRLPLVGPLEDTLMPTLWLCTGMGARGLSFSALCAELLVAEMCGEPLPLESSLAKSLSTRRPRRARTPS